MSNKSAMNRISIHVHTDNDIKLFLRKEGIEKKHHTRKYENRKQLTFTHIRHFSYILSELYHACLNFTPERRLGYNVHFFVKQLFYLISSDLKKEHLKEDYYVKKLVKMINNILNKSLFKLPMVVEPRSTNMVLVNGFINKDFELDCRIVAITHTDVERHLRGREVRSLFKKDYPLYTYFKELSKLAKEKLASQEQ